MKWLQNFGRKVGNHKGFTLVEILIVLVILAIIAAAAIPIITAQTSQGYKKEAYDQLTALKNAMVTYYQTNQLNPNTYTGATFGTINFSPGNNGASGVSTATGMKSHFDYVLTVTDGSHWNCKATAATATGAAAGDITINEAGALTGNTGGPYV